MTVRRLFFIFFDDDAPFSTSTHRYFFDTVDFDDESMFFDDVVHWASRNRKFAVYKPPHPTLTRCFDLPTGGDSWLRWFIVNFLPTLKSTDDCSSSLPLLQLFSHITKCMSLNRQQRANLAAQCYSTLMTFCYNQKHILSHYTIFHHRTKTTEKSTKWHVY